jgi:hypothetical protein
MEIIRPQPKTYRTRRRRKPLAQAKSYRVVSEEVDGQTFRRTEFALRWAPWIMGGVLMVSVLIGLALVRKQWLSIRISNEACINQMLWTQPKEGWDTPEVDEDLLRLCYEREKLF